MILFITAWQSVAFELYQLLVHLSFKHQEYWTNESTTLPKQIQNGSKVDLPHHSPRIFICCNNCNSINHICSLSNLCTLQTAHKRRAMEIIYYRTCYHQSNIDINEQWKEETWAIFQNAHCEKVLVSGFQWDLCFQGKVENISRIANAVPCHSLF